MECVSVIHSLRQGEKSSSQRGVGGGCQKRRCVVDLLCRGQRRSTPLDQIEMFTHFQNEWPIYIWIVYFFHSNSLLKQYLIGTMAATENMIDRQGSVWGNRFKYIFFKQIWSNLVCNTKYNISYKLVPHTRSSTVNGCHQNGRLNS